MAEDAGKQTPPSLDEFSKRLDAARGDKTDASGSRTATGAALGRAFRIASELVAALIVGLLLGVGLDKVFHTAPWLLLGGILLGFAAGIVNVSRAMTKMNEPPSDSG